MAGEGVLKIEEELVCKRELPLRPSSPDSICPICLDQVTETAFVESCLHKFCLHCLVEWSRVKPECPLCKVRFNLILHNVRAINDYDEMRIPWTPSSPPSPSLVHSNFFIRVAFQRPRFTLRPEPRLNDDPNDLRSGWESPSILGPGMTLRQYLERELLGNSSSSGASSNNDSSTIPVPSVLSGIDDSSSSHSSLTSPGLTVAADWRRRRQVSAVEFRRQIYRQNQWVQPAGRQILRERVSSPSFYRANPAQLHRMVPWLNRELGVLLDSRLDSHRHVIVRILSALTTVHIRSSRFYRMMWQWLGSRTSHFIHELYYFAISPYDMMLYDLHSEYTRMETFVDSVPTIDAEQPYPTRWGSPLQPSSQDDVILLPGGRASSPIVISDTEEVRDDDSDSSVIVVGSLPPPALRSPVEVISLLESEEEVLNCEEVPITVEVDPPTPLSPVQTTSDNIRLRTTSRPYYKESSSSSSLSSSSDSSCVKSSKSKPSRKSLKKRKRERCSPSSSSDEEEPVRKKKSPEKKKKPLPRLKSVIKKVNSEAAGCSSWMVMSPERNSNKSSHSLRPRRSRAFEWDDSSTD